MTKIYIIDVRDEDEYALGHKDNAINIPVNLIYNKDIKAMSLFESMDKDKDEINVYCASGGRAELAKTIFLKMGFKHVTNLGGFC